MKVVNESVIKALAKAMADARAGSIEAVCIITASPGGVPGIAYSGESDLMPTINVGADMVKAYVIGQVLQVSMQQASGLVRPAVGNG